MLGLKLNHVSKRGHSRQLLCRASCNLWDTVYEEYFLPNIATQRTKIAVLHVMIYGWVNARKSNSIANDWSYIFLALTHRYVLAFHESREFLFWINNTINTLRQRQNGRHFADDIFKCMFLNENVWILINISLKFATKGQINKFPALV